MTKNNSIIVFDPHSDDADWWTGGLTLLLRKKGWTVHYVCVGPAEGEAKENALKSAEILGVSRIFFDIPISGNKSFPTMLREKVQGIVADIAPQIIFIPSLTDYHQEHVMLSRELFHLSYWNAGFPIGSMEIYAYDSHENRDPVEIYIDISEVWETHIESLRCHKTFERPTIPENTLIRVKEGRAMLLGTSVPAEPVLYAEGYRLLQGDVKKISILPELLPEEFYYRNAQRLLQM